MLLRQCFSFSENQSTVMEMGTAQVTFRLRYPYDERLTPNSDVGVVKIQAAD